MLGQRKHKQSVLLFDCDFELAKSIKIYLEESYFVKIISHENMVVSELNKTKYDFFIFDYSCMNDCLVELIDKIHILSPTTKNILMCTYLNAEMNNERVILSKIDDCIFKPFNVNLLKQKLSRLNPQKQVLKILN